MSKSKSSTKKSSSSASANANAPVGSAAQYKKYLPKAMKLASSAVRPMHGDLALGLVNARRGAAAVLAKSARLKKELPGVSLSAIRELANLGLGVAYAAGQVERYAAPASSLKQNLSRAHALRALLITSADALVEAGVLPAAAVARIHAGHGGIDAAGDCVALAALFKKYASALRGKSPVTAADINEAAEVGTTLLGALKPRGARGKPTSQALKTAVDARNRLWTLFEQSWEQNAWRAGAWLFGRDVDAHVPPLQSRAGHRSAKPKPAAAPKPAPKPPAPSPAAPSLTDGAGA
jgi:hypothetical protein